MLTTLLVYNINIPPNSQMNILQIIILQGLLKEQFYRILKT